MKVTIYTIPTCSFCAQAKTYLTSKGIAFEEKDVQSNKENLTEMLAASNNFAGVPCTIVMKDSGEKVVLKGFTQSEFEQAFGAEAGAGAGTGAEAGTGASMEDSAADGMGTGAASTGMGAAGAAGSAGTAGVGTDLGTGAPTVSGTADVGMSTGAGAPDVSGMSAAGSTGPANTTSGVADASPTTAMPTLSQDMMGGANPAMAAANSAMAAAATPSQNEPMDPQSELSGLLKDLETKTADAGATPNPTGTPAPMSPTPQSAAPTESSAGAAPSTSTDPMSSTAPTADAPAAGAPPAAPAIPDFPKAA